MLRGVTSTRRDAGRPRGKSIEQRILAETLRELAEHGVAGASIARIAEAAQVNKTSVYRRWATKEELVAAALEDTLRSTAEELRDTGSLRGDLGLLLELVVARLGALGGRALVLASMSDAAGDAVAALAGDPLRRTQEAAVALVSRAIERGEWDGERFQPEAVFAMLTGGVMHRLLLERQPVTEGWARTVAEVIARGVRPDAAPAGGRARKNRRR